MKKKGIVARCKLSFYKQNRLLTLFESGSTARGAAKIVHVNRMTAILFFRKLRLKLFEEPKEPQKKYAQEAAPSYK